MMRRPSDARHRLIRETARPPCVGRIPPRCHKHGATSVRARAHDPLASLGLAEDGQRPVGALPYGKQRKIEIARALISDPKILLLDEPAAGLNSGEVEGLIDLVNGLRAQGLSILLIEHNMGLVMRLADSITVINFGQRIAEGPPEAIRSDERVIEAYLGRRGAYARV